MKSQTKVLNFFGEGLRKEIYQDETKIRNSQMLSIQSKLQVNKSVGLDGHRQGRPNYVIMGRWEPLTLAIIKSSNV